MRDDNLGASCLQLIAMFMLLMLVTVMQYYNADSVSVRSRHYQSSLFVMSTLSIVCWL